MKKKINVVHVMPQIGIGGAETQLYALITNSDPQVVTHEVLYYSNSRDDNGLKLYTNAGIKYTRIPRKKKRPIKFLRDLAAAIEARKPDIVQCWLYSGNIWGRWAAILAGAKHIIVTYRCSVVSHESLVRFLEQFTTHRVHYLANSRACADIVAKSIGVSPDRFHVIYNGIDLDVFAIAPAKNLKAELGISLENTLAIMVGRLTYAKNYPMLLNVASLCKQRKLPIHFAIVGCGEKDAYLKSLAAHLDVNDIVHFLGIRNDISSLLKGCDIFCYTSWYEGFPNALLEAMAAGLPVITTNFASVDELVQNGITGLIVPQDDANAACDCLKNYIDNPAVTETFGRKGQLFVQERFAMQNMVKKTCLFYQAISNGKVPDSSCRSD